jgi:CheY-like chemotaxis protein
VLVTDDSDVNRETLSHLLRLWGAQALEARDGLEAVEIAVSEPLDLIFMDLLMPRLGGIGAAQRIRERGITVPIVALTAGGTEDMVEALEVGMNDAIFKPVSGRLLQEILAQYTGFAPAIRSGRDEGARRAMMETFRREFGGNRDALVEAVRSGDSAQAEMWAHRLKGEASQTGQLHLIPVLDRIEAAARRGTPLSAYLESLEELVLEEPTEKKE